MKWVYLATVIGSTTISDLLQSKEMKRQGSKGSFRPTLLLVVAIAFMAISFFAFLQLLTLADLSFAVPASAASFVLETLLARLLLGERVQGRRWGGAILVTLGVALLGHS